MNVKASIINWICALTLLLGQWAAVEVQACDMHVQNMNSDNMSHHMDMSENVEMSEHMDMSGHQHHADMTEPQPTHTSDSCCDDCDCAMSTCQSHHKLLTVHDMIWHHGNAVHSFYHTSLRFNRPVESPLRPPIS